MQTRRKPGPPPGTHHAGTWKPGVSGNPSGRPKMSERQKSFEEICRDYVADLVPVLAEAVQDRSIPLRDRTVAFELLAANGHGTPVNRSVHVSLTGGAGSTESIPRDVLEARAAAILSRDIPAEYTEVTDV